MDGKSEKNDHYQGALQSVNEGGDGQSKPIYQINPISVSLLDKNETKKSFIKQ